MGDGSSETRHPHDEAHAASGDAETRFDAETEIVTPSAHDEPASSPGAEAFGDTHGAAAKGRAESGKAGSSPSPMGEMALIRAARTQAQQRSRPAMQGGGFAVGIPGYTMERELHRGGQGIVYLAIQQGTGRRVAIKLMREGTLARQSERIRFEREIQVLAQLDHPNIVTIHDSGVAGGCGYYVMDYITGKTLDDYVESNELSIGEKLGLVATLCRAVDAAHRRGIVHRDLKPGNIRVTPEGEPHILDFGLAKIESLDGQTGDAPTQMTVVGEFIGSLAWASPEQARGETDAIDGRTDVYALGVILYQLLTGRLPLEFPEGVTDAVQRISKEAPPLPRSLVPALPVAVEKIVMRAIAKSRDARFDSPGAMATAIERFFAGEVTSLIEGLAAEESDAIEAHSAGSAPDGSVDQPESAMSSAHAVAEGRSRLLVWALLWALSGAVLGSVLSIGIVQGLHGASQRSPAATPLDTAGEVELERARNALAELTRANRALQDRVIQLEAMQLDADED